MEWYERRQADDICLERERSDSKMMPRLRAEVEGDRVEPEKESVLDEILERCCGVPIKRNSVLDGLRER